MQKWCIILGFIGSPSVWRFCTLKFLIFLTYAFYYFYKNLQYIYLLFRSLIQLISSQKFIEENRQHFCSFTITTMLILNTYWKHLFVISSFFVSALKGRLMHVSVFWLYVHALKYNYAEGNWSRQVISGNGCSLNMCMGQVDVNKGCVVIIGVTSSKAWHDCHVAVSNTFLMLLHC